MKTFKDVEEKIKSEFVPEIEAWFNQLRVSGVALTEEVLKHLEEKVELLKQEAEHTAESIHAWFVSHIHNSPASQDTIVFNHLRAAVEKLKKRLTQ